MSFVTTVPQSRDIKCYKPLLVAKREFRSLAETAKTDVVEGDQQ